jgi:hypothetical protein
MVSKISVPGHVMSYFFIASGGICGSRSAFWCVQFVKCDRTIFHARVGSVQI